MALGARPFSFLKGGSCGWVLGVAQYYAAGVTQVSVLVSMYQGAILGIPFFAPQANVLLVPLVA